MLETLAVSNARTPHIEATHHSLGSRNVSKSSTFCTMFKLLMRCTLTNEAKCWIDPKTENVLIEKPYMQLVAD